MEGSPRPAVALVTATRGFVVERQNAASLATFGGIIGMPWVRLGRAPLETIRLGHSAIEETLDTGELVRWVSESDAGPGDSSALALRTGMVLTTWQPVIVETPAVDLDRLAAEYWDRVAWALREHRPVPHLPDALRRLLQPAGR